MLAGKKSSGLEKRLTAKEFADQIEVSLRTLQRLVQQGKIQPYRDIRGIPYYTEQHYLDYINMPNNRKLNEVYMKVSFSNQIVTSSEINSLRTLCEKKLGVRIEILSDSKTQYK